MNFPTEVFGNVAVVHTPDELYAEAAQSLVDYATTLDQSHVVFDLDGTELLGSAGLTALLDAHDKLRQLGGDLKIATTNRANRKILEMTRLDQTLEVHDSVIDAVRGMKEEG